MREYHSFLYISHTSVTQLGEPTHIATHMSPIIKHRCKCHDASTVTPALPNVELKIKIEMNLKGIECEDVDWIHLAQDRVQWRPL